MSQQKNEEFQIDEEVFETELANLKEILSVNKSLIFSIKKDVDGNKKIREVLKKYPFGNLENPKLNKFHFWINTPRSVIDQNTAKGDDRHKYPFDYFIDLLDDRTPDKDVRDMISDYVIASFDDRCPDPNTMARLVYFCCQAKVNCSQIITKMTTLMTTCWQKNVPHRKKWVNQFVVPLMKWSNDSMSETLLEILFNAIVNPRNVNKQELILFCEKILSILHTDLKLSKQKTDLTKSPLVKKDRESAVYILFREAIDSCEHIFGHIKSIRLNLSEESGVKKILSSMIMLYIESKQHTELLLTPLEIRSRCFIINNISKGNSNNILELILELDVISPISSCVVSLICLDNILDYSSHMNSPLCYRSLYECYMFKQKSSRGPSYHEEEPPDINQRNSKTGETIFHKKCKTKSDKNKEHLKYLLNKMESTDILNKIDNNGHSALYNAVQTEKWDFVDLLLQHGASPSVKGKQSNGPVHLALDRNKLDVIQTFARVGGLECLLVKNQNGFSVIERLIGNEHLGDIFKCGLYRYIQKLEPEPNELMRQARLKRDKNSQMSIRESKLMVMSIVRLIFYLSERQVLMDLFLKQQPRDKDIKLASIGVQKDEKSAEERIIEDICATQTDSEKPFEQIQAAIIADKNTSKIFFEVENGILLYWIQFANELSTETSYKVFIQSEIENLYSKLSLLGISNTSKSCPPFKIPSEDVKMEE